MVGQGKAAGPKDSLVGHGVCSALHGWSFWMPVFPLPRVCEKVVQLPKGAVKQHTRCSPRISTFQGGDHRTKRTCWVMDPGMHVCTHML